MEGTVTWFAEHKGYGYIRADDGTDVYVDHGQIVGVGFRTLESGERVRFTLTDDGRGPAAAGVQPAPRSETS